MKEPIIINESKVIEKSGDITFYKTVTEAENALEPVDVKNEEYFAFDSQGHLLQLNIVEDKIVLEDRTPTVQCQRTLEAVMTDYLLRLNIPEQELHDLDFSILLERIEKYCAVI